MAVSDPVADMLTKIRNASRAGFDRVDITPSKLKLEIVKVMKNEGFIKNFKKIQQDGKNYIRLFLKYDEAEKPIIHGIEKISTPGRRIYSGYKEMPRVRNGYGTIVVSTSSGVTTGKKATDKKIGGEVICSIW
ncbi:MAG: 30S ribosomal protein S8 [Spirochaetia bacterium]|jgi:small subunit ribosomal protein S8|nr:30S ribosomal protein S8 [Spirochaetia bacterium]